MIFPPKSALVVEDDPSHRAATQLMLRQMGFDSVAVEDGAQAWARLKRESFDLILSDWHMEPMDGMALLRAVRADARLAATPVVMMSADLTLSAWRDAICAGASDFLLKPFARRQLLEAAAIAIGAPVTGRSNVIDFRAL